MIKHNASASVSGRGSRIKRAVTNALLASVLVSGIVGGVTATATPAQAASSYMTTSWTPWTSPWSQGSQYWTVKAGTSVTMRCWTTGATRLNTAKWFYITSNAYPYTRGYVPANAVGAQTIVGHC